MTSLPIESPAVLETQLVHDAQRRVTSMLADALSPFPAPTSTVGELRDFVVAMLDHHHRSEDTDLWPLLTDRAPVLTDALAALSSEHDQLDVALHELAAASIDSLNGAGCAAAARNVRDLVHTHLGHEEPVLFPALRTHLTDEDWFAFSQRTVAVAPQAGAHFFIGLFHEVGTEQQIDLVLRQLPPDARAAIPEMRAAAMRTFAELERSSTTSSR
jgi:hemerythrin-like domain-containing protein